MQIESCDQFESAKPVALDVPPSSIARADEVFELDRLICLWHFSVISGHAGDVGYRVAHSSRCCGALLIGIAAIALLFAYEII